MNGEPGLLLLGALGLLDSRDGAGIALKCLRTEIVEFLATRYMYCTSPGETRLPLELLLSLPTVGLTTAVSVVSAVTRLLSERLSLYKVLRVPAWIVTSH